MKHTNGALKDMARQMLLGHYRTPMLCMLLASLIPSLFLLPFSYLCSDRDTIPSQAVLFYLAYFIIMLIELLLSCGVNRVHLLLARGQAPKAADMFWVIKNRPDRILIGSVLFLLLSWIPQLPSFWFELNATSLLSDQNELLTLAVTVVLSRVGAVFGFLLTLPLYFCFWIFADDPNAETRDAFTRSIRLMRGVKWKLCLMELSFIGWWLLGTLSAGIGFLWISPYLTQSVTNLYLDQTHAFDATVE